MDKLIRLSCSDVGELEKIAISDIIDAGYLGMGKTVGEFEDKIKKLLGAEEVVCVNSGTAALHLGLMGMGLNPGDEVLVQSLTYVASFQAITASMLVPVACEIIPETFTIDLDDARKRLTPRTRAIMPVHYAGRTGDIDEIYAFANKHGLRIIEDAAHAFGCRADSGMVGATSDIACFSFDGIKNITSGEGGCVVTSDKNLADYVRDARLLGVKRDTEKRLAGARSWEFECQHQGYRYHMSELFAAIGIAQLSRLENEFGPRRKELARNYDVMLDGIEGIVTFTGNYDKIIPHIYPIRVKGRMRDGLIGHMKGAGIEAVIA
ncbi:MAG TPA: DegT/DnrJ/EryC1/StrS family aminotransferase [Nitrospirae bacterium]|nr:DegT/DnrJ/EryC1/StrS family aminotransferase [Nitrospirota bacterium]